jgi:hypothetical protein
MEKQTRIQTVIVSYHHAIQSFALSHETKYKSKKEKNNLYRHKHRVYAGSVLGSSPQSTVGVGRRKIQKNAILFLETGTNIQQVIRKTNRHPH